jgi:hypothetical protein
VLLCSECTSNSKKTTLELAKTLYKYDNSGNRIEEACFDSTGNLEKKTTYQYNGKRFLTNVNIFNSKDNFNKKITYDYKYDTKGNWIEKVDYSNNEAVKITEREFEYY